MTSLGTELPKEMARVRDVIIPQYLDIGPEGNFALTLMRGSLDRAAVAMAEGDLPMMILAYTELRDYK